MAGTHFSKTNFVFSYMAATHLQTEVQTHHFIVFIILWDLKLVFPPLGQLVTFSWWGLVYRATRLVLLWGWWMPGSGDCSGQSPTQGFSKDVAHTTATKAHHLRGHSAWENIPRDCSCQALQTWVWKLVIAWLLLPCRGQKFIQGKDKTLLLSETIVMEFMHIFSLPYSFSISSFFLSLE